MSDSYSFLTKNFVLSECKGTKNPRYTQQGTTAFFEKCAQKANKPPFWAFVFCLKNYEKIAEFFKVPVSNIVKSTQIHEDNILKITSYHHGMGIVKETEITNADGIYTNTKNQF